MVKETNPILKNIPEPEDILSKAGPAADKTKQAEKKEFKAEVNYEKRPQLAGRHDNKVALLMLGAVAVIIIITVGWYVFSSLSSGSKENTSEVNMDNSTDAVPAVQDILPSPEELDRIEILDSDYDGLDDVREEELGLNINNSDSDNDNLSDKDEVDIYFTDALNPDTDGDGFLDGDEVRYGFNPNGPGKLNDIFKVLNEQ